MLWRLLALVKAIIGLERPSAIDGGISATSQLSKTKPRTGSAVIVGVKVGEGDTVGVALKVAVGLALGLGVAVAVAVGAGVAVYVGVGLGSGDGTDVFVGGMLGDGLGVSVGWLRALQAARRIKMTGKRNRCVL